MEVTAVVDAGSNYLCLPSRIVLKLGLGACDVRILTAVDGTSRECSYVGPVEIRFEDRLCYVGALELGNEVVLGAIPMRDMNLVVNPTSQRLTVNPDYPKTAHALVKGNRSIIRK